jgi:hypothetical protein
LKTSKDRRAPGYAGKKPLREEHPHLRPSERKFNQSKETKMFKNRLFNVLIAIALVITLAFTAREAFATTLLRSEVNAVAACESLPSRHSIHTEYVKEANLWIVRTENGPTGVDGGLIDLLSNYRNCSR